MFNNICWIIIVIIYNIDYKSASSRFSVVVVFFPHFGISHLIFEASFPPLWLPCGILLNYLGVSLAGCEEGTEAIGCFYPHDKSWWQLEKKGWARKGQLSDKSGRWGKLDMGREWPWYLPVLTSCLPRKCHSEVFRKGCCHGNWIGSSPPGCMGTSALMYSGCPCAAGGKRAVTVRLQKHHGKYRADKVCHERTDYSMWQGIKPRMPQSLFLN